jgi:hypothetical protein
MRVTLTFETDALFSPDTRPILEAYFRGELDAAEAASRLGYDKPLWVAQLAGIFSEALLGHGTRAILTMQQPSPRRGGSDQRAHRQRSPQEDHPCASTKTPTAPSTSTA